MKKFYQNLTIGKKILIHFSIILLLLIIIPLLSTKIKFEIGMILWISCFFFEIFLIVWSFSKNKSNKVSKKEKNIQHNNNIEVNTVSSDKMIETVSTFSKIEPVNDKTSYQRNLSKNSQFLENYTVIDVETTGLSSDDKIIEIAAVKIQNGEIIDSFNTLVNPKMHINSGATKVNGICDEMVQNSPIFSEIEDELLSFIGNDVLVGHNIQFDLKCINRELTSILDNDYQDTLTIAHRVVPNIENHKLITLAKYFNISDSQQHRALGDSEITFKLYEALKKEKSSKKLPTFNIKTEERLLNELANSSKDLVKKHFIYLQLEDFYYKYRDLDEKYIDECAKYCYEDINILVDMEKQYIAEEFEKNEKFNPKYAQQIKNEGFTGRIPSFSRLVIIYEKRNDFDKAIEICEKAIAVKHEATEYTERKNKLLEKKNKYKK